MKEKQVEYWATMKCSECPYSKQIYEDTESKYCTYQFHWQDGDRCPRDIAQLIIEEKQNDTMS